ncbi:hypothetical protein M5K25_015547 [Dendrobium thyrsiflorum]|uniref:Uncharacterized protein n=1 Tax=Dendrobium thyrsiflorum TaxID=117978 RepID=A0ABD0UYI7_DENTH
MIFVELPAFYLLTSAARAEIAGRKDLITTKNGGQFALACAAENLREDIHSSGIPFSPFAQSRSSGSLSSLSRDCPDKFYADFHGFCVPNRFGNKLDIPKTLPLVQGEGYECAILHLIGGPTITLSFGTVRLYPLYSNPASRILSETHRFLATTVGQVSLSIFGSCIIPFSVYSRFGVP